MSLAAGTRLGAFEITGQLGVGGMGEVYRATDRTLEREVAIKVLPESFAADADRIARFEQEARTLASLNHTNIAQIHGLEKADGKTAIVMELVEGPTLADRIEQGPLPPDEALNIAMQIANALEAAHDKGIVHRDLKPANIKLKRDSTVKVLDFGIAKAFEPNLLSGDAQSPVMTTPVTQTGIILGTAAYMSPEQARGKAIDQRTDIWAFACVLYEMLTGQSAFGGEDVAVTLARVIAHGTDTDSLPATISPAVRHTIELCLEKDPSKRIADVRDVRLALEGRFETPLPAAAATTVTAPLWRRMLPSAATLMIGAIVAGSLVWIVMRPTPPQPRPVSRYLITPPAATPLAALAGYDVVISPDGRRLAYFAEDTASNTVTLYLRDLDSLEARALPGTTFGSGGGGANPFFSPDGEWIGFNAPGQGIIRVAVNGGPPIKMADIETGFLGAQAGEDGTMIYSGVDALYRVSVRGGGTSERLTPEEGAPVQYIAPTFLPGQRTALFAFGNERVGLLDLQTREQTVLIEGGQNPTYAATGHIVFARGTTLMAVPFDLETLTVRGDPVAVVQGVRRPDGNAASDHSLSASGTLVYVPGTDEGSAAAGEVVWVDRNGEITERAVGELVENPRDPRLSPDGRRLVLTTGPFIDGDVWVYDLGGRPPIPLASEGSNRFAVWSPDGSEIAFASSGDSIALYIVPADGSVLDPVPLGPQGVAPAAWSADGELILARPGTNFDILAARVEPDMQIRDVVVTVEDERDAALSPNGRWLAYTSTRTGTAEIWVMGYPEGVPVRISRAGGREPVWSRDGRELFYLQQNSMMALAVETEEEFSFDAAEELFARPYFVTGARFARSYDVAADGRFLMINSVTGSSGFAGSDSIVVVENWFEELQRLVPTQ